MPRGALPGERRGGRQKGTPNKATLTKEAMRERLRERVAEEFDPLIDAQFAHAKGLKYLVARNAKTGKFERVTPAMLDAQGDALLERVEVWEKDPSVQAFTDLMNRALDKPKEQDIDVTVHGVLEVVTARLTAARKRLAGTVADAAD